MRRQTERALADARRSAREEQGALELLKRLSDEYPNGCLDPALHIELPGGVSMSFQFVPAGSFRMGSRAEHAWEQPVHSVRISSPFLMGTYPVTQRQFAAWTEEHGVEHRNEFPGRDSNPAENLDWRQAMAFCDWLTPIASLPKGWRVALPSEAQWEYACRSGTDTDYHSGDGEAALRDAGWFDGNSRSRTRSVGQLQPNSWGLYDMHGNVWEWCQDVWDRLIYRSRRSEVTDPARLALPGEDADAVIRVVRGGASIYSARHCCAGHRDGGRPGHRFGYLGFRVCLLPGPTAKQAEAPDGESK